ncbi:MAG: hypothetical protein SangKO_095420 [Sandaracinaceae bacterium]
MADWKKLIIAVGVALAALAIALFAGRVWGEATAWPELEASRQRVAASEAELATTRTAHQRALDELGQHAVEMERRVSHLEARRQIALAIDELDQRNFGLARRHCQRAAETLGAAMTGEPALGELADQLATFQFELDGDFDDTRRRLRAHADTLDRVLSPGPEPGPPGA